VLATLLSFGVYLMGNFSQDLVELGRLSRNPSTPYSRFISCLALSRLDLKNQAVYGSELLPNPLTLIANAGYGLLYTVLVLAIAIPHFLAP